VTALVHYMELWSYAVAFIDRNDTIGSLARSHLLDCGEISSQHDCKSTLTLTLRPHHAFTLCIVSMCS
jgi:hypothetical protein